MAASTLSFEALVVFFAGLVAKNLPDLSTGTALWVSGLLALACLVTAGLLRRPFGYVLGSILQVGVLALGFWVPDMFGVGAVFVLLWVLALVLGRRVERQARERWAAQDRA